MPAAVLDEARQRSGEAEAEGVEYGIGNVGGAHRGHALDVTLERIQALPKVRDHDHAASQFRDQAEILAVNAQQEVHSGGARPADGLRIKGVDAHPKAPLLE